MSEKTHYRKVFKSDHLGSADLEDLTEKGIKLIFTIQEVTQHLIDPNIKGSGVRVAGKNISANIAHFIEDVKPLVLNATNSKQVANITGTNFVQDWQNVKVELFIDQSVKFKGASVQGVRIRSGFQITLQVINDLYKVKKDKVAENQREGLERVILEEEKLSYKKVYNYLIKL
jgi:hypothetical protein